MVVVAVQGAPLVPFSYQEIARAPARDSKAISALTSTGTPFRIPRSSHGLS